MSAPTPATGDSSPTPGYYPDPSIPGYVRYWNGGAWVPGTSRPAPETGEDLPAPPSSAGAAPAPAHTAHAPAPASVEETGPVFLDEEPDVEPSRPEPASAWQANAARQAGFGGDLDNRVSWGGGGDPRTADRPGTGGAAADPRRPADSAADPSGGRLPGMRAVPGQDDAPEVRPVAPSAADGPLTDGTVTIRALRPGAAGDAPAGRQPAEHTVAIRAQRPGAPPEPAQADGTMAIRSLGGSGAAAPPQQPGPGLPSQPLSSGPAQQPAQQQPQAAPAVTDGPGGGAASWAQQVHRLAHSGPAAPEGEQPVVPWKPPVNDPFLAVAQAQAAARPASLARRLGARMIDGLVLGALVGAVAVPVVSSALAHIDDKIEAAKLSGETVTVWLIDGTTAGQIGIVLAALLVLGVLYEALPTAKWGRTLGKKLCGVKVVDIESHEPPSFGAALRRWLVYGVLGVLVLGVVNVLWCLFDRPWRQCWHDKVAHTFVTG